MEPVCWLCKKGSGFQNQLPKETSPHLLLGAQDQQPGAEKDQLPCGSTGTPATFKRRKHAWFGHITPHDGLSKAIPQGTLEDGRRRGRQRRWWIDNIRDLTSPPVPELLTRASCSKDWKRIPAESFLMSPGQPNRLRNWTKSLKGICFKTSRWFYIDYIENEFFSNCIQWPDTSDMRSYWSRPNINGATACDRWDTTFLCIWSR